MPIDSVIYSYIEGHENYPDKAVIIEENAKGDWVYVVLKGQVKVKKKTPKGFVTVYTLKEGEIFGEIALFGKRKGVRTATIVADGPVEIGVLDKVRLDSEFQSLSPQLKSLISTLVSNLGRAINDACLLAIE